MSGLLPARPGPRTGELACLREALPTDDGRHAARLQRSGQIFLPRAVRDALGLEGGEVFAFRTSGASVVAEPGDRRTDLASRVTSRGLVTIPLAIRDRLALGPGDFLWIAAAGRRITISTLDRQGAVR